MCCLVTIFVLLGPRIGILFWWLFDADRWEQAFSTFIWPLLGTIFLPWTTLAYVFVFPSGVNGIDWLWMAIGILLDISSYSSSGYVNRDRLGRRYR